MRFIARTTRRQHLRAMGLAGVHALVGGGLPGAWGEADGGIRLGTQMNAYAIQAKDFATLLWALGEAKAIGFAGFETGYRTVMDQFAAPAEARAKIAAAGLVFFGVHIFMSHELYDRETLIAPASVYEAVARGGKALGAQRVIVSGAAAADAGQLKAKIAGLGRAGRFCREAGIGFAYHNEEPESGSKLHELEALYRECDPECVGFVLDVGHLFRAGGDVVGFGRAHAGRIVGLHLRDFKDGQQVVLGTGELPLRELARALKEVGWTGWVETEEERLDGVKHGDEYLRPAFAAMKGAFGR